MRDNEISTEEMPFLIIQYIMHKNGGTKTREKSSVVPRENNKMDFSEQSLLISKMQPISFILVVPIHIVL